MKKNFFGQHALRLAEAYQQAVALATCSEKYDIDNALDEKSLAILEAADSDHQRHGLSILQEAMFNSWFDSGVPLGQTAVMIALLDIYYPESDVFVSEIQENAFVPSLLKHYRSCRDTQILNDVLFTEMSRSIIFVEGRAFDQLAHFMGIQEGGIDYLHKSSPPLPAWEFLTASQLASKALLVPDSNEAQKILAEAEAICPKAIFIKQAQAWRFLIEDEPDEARQLLEVVDIVAPTAVNSYLLFLISGEGKYHSILVEKYSQEIIPLLEYRLKGLLRGFK